MSNKDEVVISLDEPSHGHGSHIHEPVDMVKRMRFITRVFLVIFLLYLAVTIIVQGVMLPTWLTSTPLAICFFGILIVGFLATRVDSFLLTNLLWWLLHPATAIILTAILIWGIVKLISGTGKYGRATMVPVIMLSVAILGALLGMFLFFKYSRFIKASRK